MWLKNGSQDPTAQSLYHGEDLFPIIRLQSALVKI